MGRHEYTTEMRSEPASAKKQSKVFWDRVGDHIRSTEVPASLATINCLIHFKISLTGPQSVKSWRLINTEYVLQHYRFPLSAHWRLAIRAVCTSSAKKENHSLLAVENVFFQHFIKNSNAQLSGGVEIKKLSLSPIAFTSSDLFRRKHFDDKGWKRIE